MKSRYELLNDAAKIVTDRGTNYGTPEENFERIAVLWTALLGRDIICPSGDNDDCFKAGTAVF